MPPTRPFYVTDTHPFVWYLAADDERLSPSAKSVFKNADSAKAVVVIPAVVLAESLYLAEKGRIKAKAVEILELVESALNYRLYPLDLSVIQIAWELKKIPEIHDRVIAATARRLGLELITDDKRIRESGYVKTLW
jgi:PIN domain nuclease of toxin-antitoxin system